jgi:hypothetical protein
VIWAEVSSIAALIGLLLSLHANVFTFFVLICAVTSALAVWGAVVAVDSWRIALAILLVVPALQSGYAIGGVMLAKLSKAEKAKVEPGTEDRPEGELQSD